MTTPTTSSYKSKILHKFLFPMNFICKKFLKLGAHIHYNLAVPIYKVQTKYGAIYLHSDSPVLLMRSMSFHQKEPETLEWIDSMSENDILYDVGANVGLYSLYASKKGLSVYAFEPESLNYAELNKNIYLNQIKNIHAYNIGLNKKTVFDSLNLSTFTKGWSMHTATQAKDFEHKPFEPAYRQGLFLASLDDLVEKFGLPVPNYLKIDVDGLEPEIIQGAEKTLQRSELKSILIELNESCSADLKVIHTLEAYGFSLQKKERADCIDSEKFATLYNFIFVKP